MSVPVSARPKVSAWPQGRRHSRSGFTLLEVLVATAVTLLMMVALAKIFKDIGDGMKQGRAALELNNRMRDVLQRVRRDLSNVTANPNMAARVSSASGYLKYYDGPFTDYTTVAPTVVTGSSLGNSKIGDVDDIFMGTVRAGDVWFTGKVPLYILERLPAPRNAADLELISVASQHAEIAMFLEPVVATTKPAVAAFNNPQREAGFLVANTDFYQDLQGDGIPDSYRLHYRALIIRPDLNLPNGLLGADPSAPYMIALPQTNNPLPDGSGTFNLPSPLCDMASVHGSCDLSVRRVYDAGDGLTGSADYVAANSLEDLMDPANRFAHVQVPAGTSASMPLLALTSNATTSANFLHPAFTLQGTRAGEDILASDMLAFDIQAYDPGAPLLGSPGVDGVNGTAVGTNNTGDDDGDGTNNELDEFGWDGSDDVVLRPHDPGYAIALGNGAATVAVGEYVDLAWAHKLRTHFGGITPGSTNIWSPLSGYSQTNFASSPVGGFPFTEGLYKSGLVNQSAALSNTRLTPFVFQPAYDTWTDGYEHDGVLQMEISGIRGTRTVLDTRSSGPAPINSETWRKPGVYIFDAATDGVDNNGIGGVDDTSELETAMPFPIRLRGLKVTVRMENLDTRTVDQLSHAEEFVSQ